MTKVINLRIPTQGHKHIATTSEFILAETCRDREIRNGHKILVGGGENLRGKKHLRDLVIDGRLAEITHYLPIRLNALVLIICCSF